MGETWRVTVMFSTLKFSKTENVKGFLIFLSLSERKRAMKSNYLTSNGLWR